MYILYPHSLRPLRASLIGMAGDELLTACTIKMTFHSARNNDVDEDYKLLRVSQIRVLGWVRGCFAFLELLCLGTSRVSCEISHVQFNFMQALNTQALKRGRSLPR